jgi:PAS domain S-box-containing protein
MLNCDLLNLGVQRAEEDAVIGTEAIPWLALFILWALIAVSVVRVRRRAAEALDELAAIVESSHDAIIGKTLDGTITSWNAAAQRMYGYQADEVIGRSIMMLVPPDRQDELRHILERIKRGERVSHLETVRLRKDGQPINVSLTISPIRNRAGRIRGASAVARDVTEHKRVEEALTKLSSAVEQTADNVFITNCDGVIEYVNPAFEQLTGYSRAQVLGKTPRVLRSGHHSQEFYAELWNRILSEGVFRAEFVNKKKNGELYYEEKTITAIRDPQGRIAHFVSTGRDVTERRRAEETLRASMERARLMMLATTDAIWDWDLVTSAVQWNHGLRTLFGYPAEAVRDHNWWKDHVHPEDIAHTEESVQVAIASGEKFWTGGYRYRRADGSYAHVVDRGYVIHDDGGRPVRMIGAMVDITDRVRLAEAQAQAAIEERQRLARDLHDSVTQSLYSLTLLAEAARSLALAGDRQLVEHYLTRLGEMAQQSLKEMRLLIYEWRPPILEKEGLVRALQQRLGAVEKRSGMKVQLLVDGAVQLPGHVEEGLYGIVQEALNNALKHAAASHVTVRVHADAPCAELEVADDGCGFDTAASDQAGGLGLLSMCERAERLGAALTIDSTPGAGTTVRVVVNRSDS